MGIIPKTETIATINPAIEITATKNKRDVENLSKVSLSWLEFKDSLSTPRIRENKDGSGFCPAIFSENKKKSENVISLQLLVVEYDHNFTLNDLDVWQPFEHFVYSSHSHLRETKCNPQSEQRLRVIILLKNKISPENYKLLYKWAFSHSKNKIDSSCRNLDRMFYLPAKFSDDSPFYFNHNRGITLDWESLNLSQYEQTQQRIRKPATINHSTNLDNNKRYALSALNKEIEKLENTDKKGDTDNIDRNTQLFASACSIGELLHIEAFSQEEVEEKLMEACEINGVIEDYGEEEVTRQAKRGLEKGQTNPRLVPEVEDSCFKILFKGDSGCAQYLAPFLENWLYDTTKKIWVHYENGVWVRDNKSKFLLVAQSLLEEIVYSRKNTPKEELKGMEKLKLKVGSFICMKQVENFLMKILSTETIEFDRSFDLMNLKNGVLNINNGLFFKHNNKQKFYQKSGVEFKKGISTDKWLEFLDLIFNKDEGTIEYIQKAVGVSLSGNAGEQKLFFCYGKGANGKSTFLNVLDELFGDYGVHLKSEIILDKRSSSDRDYNFARLYGKRICFLSELPTGQRLGEHHVKELTGGEKVTARRPFEMPFEFVPTHSIWLAGNHKPLIRKNDEGIWRRMVVIPFEKTIQASKRRPMKDMLSEFRPELPGILEWAYQGYKLVIEEGFYEAGKIKESIKSYQEESDILSEFFEDSVIYNDSNQSFIHKEIKSEVDGKSYIPCETLKSVFGKYTSWCKSNDEQKIFNSSKSLSSFLSEKGFSIKKGSKNKTTVFGIMLKH